MAKKKVLGYISVPYDAHKTYVTERFKGEVPNKEAQFPKGLGEEHPFDFESTEKVYKKVGFVAGAVNKFTDSIVGDFSIKAQNKNSQALLDSFLKESDFQTLMRSWVREGLIKGNGFMELDLDENKVRVLNANHMFVKRNKNGKVIKYNQFTGDFKRFSKDNKKFQDFDIDEIAHLPINQIPNEAYGLGIVWCNERVIENIIISDQSAQQMAERKAGAPIHVKVGIQGENPNPKAIDDFASKLQFMNNKTEWVTDANIEMSTPLNFSGINSNLIETNQYFFREFLAGIEMPEVMMGSGQLNEGIAKVQLEGFDRKINSLRILIETVIEERVFKPLLNANDLDENVTFIWDETSLEETNKKLNVVQKYLATFNITENLKRGLELEVARLLGLEDLEKILRKPEVGLDDKIEKEDKEAEEESENPEREEEETEIEQPEIPTAKPSANEINAANEIKPKQLTESQTADMTLREFVNIKEIQGFNYTDYLVRILQELRTHKFTELRGFNADDFAQGLLSKNEIERLRQILKEGFRRNQTIREIETELRESINFRDRINDEGKIVASASGRPNAIARTETVNLANIGLRNLYRDNGIKRVRFLAALSDRTCPICEGLNGQVFNINELVQGLNMPSIHSRCRCSLISVVE